MATEKFSWNLLDSLGDPIVGSTPTMRIRELSTGFSLDWNDNTFKNSGWTTLATSMVEIGAPYLGLYEKTVNLGTLTGNYQIFTDSGAYHSTTQIVLDQGALSTLQGSLSSAQANMLLELYDLMGLDPTKPLLVTKTSRVVGDINQQIASTNDITVVTRI